MIIDINLPGENGISLSKRMRRDHPNIGIIMLTVNDKTGDAALGYDNGADMYLTKPTSKDELIAAVRSLSRRLRSAENPLISSNTVWHHATVTRHRREAQNGHHSAIIWFTGLSGSGKSTLAHAIEEELYRRGCKTFVLDGDNVRQGLCGDLGFTPQDRVENIRRVGQVAKLFLEAGVIVLTAFISPYRSDREIVRNMVEHGSMITVYCDASIEVCENRDVKGLYKKARSGQLPEFTGISSPYEPPINPEVTIETGTAKLEDCVKQVIDELVLRGIIPLARS
jgi:adenylylsulfate kinase